MALKGKRRELKPIGYELFIGALSILSLINLVLIVIFNTDQQLIYVVYVINAVMTPIFLGDFFYRLFTTSSKKTYFFRGFGWADLLSSLPFPQFKILRLFRLWRVIRLFMEFGARNLVHEFITHRAENALYTWSFWSFACWSSVPWPFSMLRNRRPTPTSQRPPMPSGGPM